MVRAVTLLFDSNKFRSPTYFSVTEQLLIQVVPPVRHRDVININNQQLPKQEDEGSHTLYLQLRLYPNSISWDAGRFCRAVGAATPAFGAAYQDSAEESAA